MAICTVILFTISGVTAITHPLLYVKLLIQVGHEPLPLTVGTTVFGKRVLYLPGFFSYGHIAKVDGKRGIFRGLSLRIVTSAISTMVRSKVRQVRTGTIRHQFKTNFRIQYFLISLSQCFVSFEEGVTGFYVGLIPHLLGEVLFLQCCNLLAHFINAYAVEESVSQGYRFGSWFWGLSVQLDCSPCGFPPTVQRHHVWINWRELVKLSVVLSVSVSGCLSHVCLCVYPSSTTVSWYWLQHLPGPRNR
uniref:Mitochondrial carrier 1 n=1 Tax=Echeneis naucrates TaxID=173247 RepID=A0A665X4G0_ECHNA